MVSPVSSLFAEFALGPIEEKFFCSFKQKPVCWLRYVDDVFILWTYPLPDLQVFLHEVNKLSNSFKFTLETEQDESLHFLDVQISRSNMHFTFSVYRKPFKVNTVIPFCTNLPFKYKIAAFQSFIRIDYKICSDSQLRTEIDFIKKLH